MDLGVQIEPQFGFKFEDVLAIALDAERAGFTRLWVSDHLFLDPNAVNTDCLEAWTLLAALAVRTERIRIGPMVTAQSYRNPALLAKIAAGVDVMSKGRLDFGLGAGWKDVEYRAYGYEFPDAPTRVTQMIETLEICTRMWKEERATYQGKHYRIENALCSPKPMQKPLPIWIGGSKPRVMRAAAKYGHAFNITVSASGPGDLPDRLRDLDEACRAEKRDPKTLLRSAFLMACVGKTPAEADSRLDQLAARWKTNRAGILKDRPGLLIGTPEDAAEKLRTYADKGIGHANIMFQPYGTERDQIAALAGIAPKLA
ncbi:MAG TPA: TIGR03560 family F420-dependent LLM class oxidoreductase [Candidatus Udaeobacter sp.]|nr:TIGR03560 family F420-dependent LLM class oxidoreductase [Candidatus Udaeobacter sp.]